MNRRTLWILGGTVAGVMAVGAVLAAPLFLPEKAQRVNEAMPQGATEGTVLKQGTFEGKTGHHVSGTVKIVRIGNEHYLRFEDYQQTQGPDVFVYVTPGADPDSKSEVKAGLRVLIEGGADGGESTKVGNFHQKLPDGFDPSPYNGVGIWCDRFSVAFGAATLSNA